MRRLRIFLMSLALVAALFTAQTAMAGVGVYFGIRVGPPPPRHEIVVARPYPSAVWVRGHWRWVHGPRHYVWVRGHWVRGRPGYMWRDGYWEHRHNGWGYVEGRWHRR